MRQFCWIDHESCDHPRCIRARRGDFTCEKGHPLVTGGLCEICDVVEGVTFEEALELLTKAGCKPRRVYVH
jgi:hypothetical protein